MLLRSPTPDQIGKISLFVEGTRFGAILEGNHEENRTIVGGAPTWRRTHTPKTYPACFLPKGPFSPYLRFAVFTWTSLAQNAWKGFRARDFALGILFRFKGKAQTNKKHPLWVGKTVSLPWFTIGSKTGSWQTTQTLFKYPKARMDCPSARLQRPMTGAKGLTINPIVGPFKN